MDETTVWEVMVAITKRSDGKKEVMGSTGHKKA